MKKIDVEVKKKASERRPALSTKIENLSNEKRQSRTQQPQSIDLGSNKRVTSDGSGANVNVAPVAVSSKKSAADSDLQNGGSPLKVHSIYKAPAPSIGSDSGAKEDLSKQDASDRIQNPQNANNMPKLY